jgi:uroporphyrinogen-III synthase
MARGMGLEVIGHSLFEAEPVTWDLPDGQFDALLIGSGAVFRHGGPQLAQLAHLPIHAVGGSTAEAARAAGFEVSVVGEGGLQRVLDVMSDEPVRYLRLGGEERVPLAPHPEQTIVERAVYRMRPLSLAPQFSAQFATGQPVVALHSAAAARHFASEIDRLGLSRGRLFLLALGPRIAKAAGLGWAALHIADAPSDAALLAKAAALCK